MSHNTIILPHELLTAKQNNKLMVLPNESYSPVEYLQNLIDQLEHDIFPLFKIVESAPLTILRNTFCYIDHISQLLYGLNGSQSDRMKKVLREYNPNDKYMNMNYRQYAPYLVQLYRHDLVHNIRPFPKQILIKKNGKTTNGTSWFFIFSKHESGATFSDLLASFRDQSFRKGYCNLRYTGNQIVINTDSVFFDTVIFLDDVKQRIQSDKDTPDKIVTNYYKIIEKSYHNIDTLVLDKDGNKEVTNFMHNK